MYGMVSGLVKYVSPDTTEPAEMRERDRKQYRVSAGMLVPAEADLGGRTVMEYLLSPVKKATRKARREM
jgi:hemolysin D